LNQMKHIGDDLRYLKLGLALFFVLIVGIIGGGVNTVNADETNLTLIAGDYTIEKIEGFDVINMTGYGVLDSPGDPVLPEKIIDVPVPQDIIWSTVTVSYEVNESEVLPGYYDIPPNPPLSPMQTVDDYYDENYTDYGYDKSIINGSNTYVYERDANYPDDPVELIGFVQMKYPSRPGPLSAEAFVPGFLMGNYVRLAHRPFLYNPVTRELTLIKSVNVTIKFDTSIIITKDSPGPSDYVIITTNDIVANSDKLGNFVNLKEFYGHSVGIITEDQYGGLMGQAPNGRAEKIRQWLINNYISEGIDYVLLVGDPDPDDPLDPGDTFGDIPMKMCYPGYFSFKYRESPTDYFYADLTGNWDLDNDQIFGETLDSTHAKSPDAAIGEDTFSAIWVGKVMCDFTDTYTFHTFSDDGVRLWIDGSLEIDNWSAHLPENDYVDVAMTAGLHTIWLEFRENTGDGIIQLRWKCRSKGHPNYVPHQIIPKDHLYDATDTVGGLDVTYYDNADFTGTTVTRKDEVVDFNWGTGDKGPGGPDTGADVFVGRIPVYNDNYTQLDLILDKIIKYETDPGSITWRESILLPMKPLWDDTPCYHLGEGIRNDYASAQGFMCYRIYEEDYSPPTPELWPCTAGNVKNEWLNGYGMNTWTTHGGPTGAGGVFSSDLAPELDDTKPSFTFQASCLTGYPENSDNLGYALLKNGAVVTVSASRVSYDEHGNWTFDPNSDLNHNMAYYYTKKLIEGGNPAGVALYLTKGDVPYMGMNQLDYNLYGDPETYLLVTQANVGPTADAGGPYVENEGTLITFDGSASTDLDGDNLTYRWDFQNDGTWDTEWSNSSTANNTWYDDHSGTVLLEVSDGLVTDTDTVDVTVNNVAPSIEAGQDQTVDEGDSVQFEGNYTDPGSEDTHIATWDWGDGSPIESGTVSEEFNSTTGNVTGSHAYCDNGTYTVTLNVTDDDGGWSTDTLTVTVNNVPPLVEAGPDQTADEGELVHFKGKFTDPGWCDSHNATWEWGDVSYEPGTVDEENESPDATGNVTGKHAYCDNGEYRVTLIVEDDDGGIGEDELNVTVNNVPPEIIFLNLTYFNSWCDTVEVEFMANFSDPGWCDSHTAVWDWGDGETSNGVVSEENAEPDSTGNVTGAHTYQDAMFQHYTVTLYLYDDDGGVDTYEYKYIPGPVGGQLIPPSLSIREGILLITLLFSSMILRLNKEIVKP
jgi:hypothetical protein